MMKTLISILISASVILPLSSARAVTPPTRDVQISVSSVFVPAQVRSDSNAYVIVSGMFPNSCYSWSQGQVTNVTPMVHEIRSIAKVTQTMCLMVLVPFSQKVQLGRLPPGEHTLRFMNGDGTYFERKLVVE